MSKQQITTYSGYNKLPTKSLKELKEKVEQWIIEYGSEAKLNVGDDDETTYVEIEYKRWETDIEEHNRLMREIDDAQHRRELKQQAEEKERQLYEQLKAKYEGTK